MTVETCSKRLCSPLQETVQVVAVDTARILSFNGLRRELQCSCHLAEKNWKELENLFVVLPMEDIYEYGLLDEEGNAACPGNAGSEQLSFEWFPDLLLQKDWSNETSTNLSARYLTRQVPRLLGLQHLSQVTRERLEHMAAANASEVDEQVHLYPEIINREKITSLLVEAGLRRAAT